MTEPQGRITSDAQPILPSAPKSANAISASRVHVPAHSPVWETVAFGLRQAIIRGELIPGQHLQEPPLAERFEVSRSSVREALSQLALEGLVQIAPRRGAFVVGLTEEAIHDIYELRLLLEIHATRRAIECASDEAIAGLYPFIERIEEALNRNRPDLQAEADLNLHRQTVVLGGNSRILAAWEPNTGVIKSMMSVAATAESSRQVVVGRHRAIVQAIEARDAPALESCLRHMMASSQQFMIDQLHQVQAGMDKTTR